MKRTYLKIIVLSTAVILLFSSDVFAAGDLMTNAQKLLYDVYGILVAFSTAAAGILYVFDNISLIRLLGTTITLFMASPSLLSSILTLSLHIIGIVSDYGRLENNQWNEDYSPFRDVLSNKLQTTVQCKWRHCVERYTFTGIF